MTFRLDRIKQLFFLITAICVVMGVTDAYSQIYRNRSNTKLFLTGGVGVSSYFGDLNNSNDLLDTRINFTLGLGYYFDSRFGVRSEVTFFQLEGDDSEADDPGRRQRNLSFQSNNIEFNVVGIAHLFNRPTKYAVSSPINPYAFAGIGVTYFNPTAELDGERISLPDLMTEGVSYSQLTFIIPFGIGVKYHVTPMLSLAVEGGARIAFTDYLDDVSTTYPGAEFFSDPIAAALSDRTINGPAGPGDIRGNPDNDDFYGLLSLKVVYYLGSDRTIGYGNRAKVRSNRNNRRAIQKRKPVKRRSGLFKKRRR
ncbi:MAG: DUF6089 family protein [Bacteroidota bacterium]